MTCRPSFILMIRTLSNSQQTSTLPNRLSQTTTPSPMAEVNLCLTFVPCFILVLHQCNAPECVRQRAVFLFPCNSNRSGIFVNVNDIALHVNACGSMKNSITNLKHFISPAYRFLKKRPIPSPLCLYYTTVKKNLHRIMQTFIIFNLVRNFYEF